ncbi:phage tail protein [Vagococcus carniphilus]|uniref:major tail protein n=1 Tax=Vagococcus carniphilus TaxID=218144 RepID=UPI00288FC1A9|nr:major tail protein [Vagococcus carniphilus]MDT2850178.1 phage tail protein [Vagococcus carniphilus]
MAEKNSVIYFEGIDDLLICFMEEEDTITTEPKYEAEVHRLPIITKLGVKGNGSTKVKYASSKVFRRVSKEDKHDLELEHVGIPIKILDQMKALTSNRGVVFTKGVAKSNPYFALGFIGRMENGERMAVWYPKVQLNDATELDYETTEEEDDIKDVKASFSAGCLLFNEVLNGAFDSTRKDTDQISLEEFIKVPMYKEEQLKK